MHAGDQSARLETDNEARQQSDQIVPAVGGGCVRHQPLQQEGRAQGGPGLPVAASSRRPLRCGVLAGQRLSPHAIKKKKAIRKQRRPLGTGAVLRNDGVPMKTVYVELE